MWGEKTPIQQPKTLFIMIYIELVCIHFLNSTIITDSCNVRILVNYILLFLETLGSLDSLQLSDERHHRPQVWKSVYKWIEVTDTNINIYSNKRQKCLQHYCTSVHYIRFLQTLLQFNIIIINIFFFSSNNSDIFKASFHEVYAGMVLVSISSMCFGTFGLPCI